MGKLVHGGKVYADIYHGEPAEPVRELFSFNQSQGGAWVNTYVDVTNIDTLRFAFSSGTDDLLMRQLPTSDIAVYTGGQDVYTTIFTQVEIGKALNVRIYNDVLWASFNGTGASTNVVTVYEPETIPLKETANVFRWYYNSATTCWGVLKKASGDCIGMNGDNADTNVTLDGDLMTVVFHGNSQSVEVTAKSAIILKKYSTGRTLGTVTPDTYSMSANDTQTFTQDNVYGGLFFEAIPNT